MRGNLEDPTTILKDPATILEDPATIFEDFAAIRVEDPANILIISLQRSPRILVQDLVQDPKRFYRIHSRILSNMRVLDRILCNPTGSLKIP